MSLKGIHFTDQFTNRADSDFIWLCLIIELLLITRGCIYISDLHNSFKCI